MTANGHILLIEDDPNLGQVLKDHLEMNGYEVTLCTDGVVATEAVRKQTFTLCLVDVMMPRMDGFSFAQNFRQQNTDTPLIFLTARSMTEDKIKGFQIGCDDYITKPFSVEELMLRIEAVLKRSRQHQSELPEDFSIGRYRFNYTRSTLTLDGDTQKLTPRESDLLRLLCLHLNQTLTRDTALKEIWNDDSYFSGRSMDVYISRLRKYLREDSSVEILGIHGKGFRLVVSTDTN